VASGEERKQLARRDEEAQVTSYVVRNKQYVLAEAADLSIVCDCCTEPCRYYNFRHCSISDDPNDDPPCMEDMPKYISICTRQFNEFDRLRRECDFEPTDWWFRVRFWDGEGHNGSGCYSGKTDIQIPEDPDNPNGTSSPLGQVVVRQPLGTPYCGYQCGWARGSSTTSGLPRIIDEKNNGCDPQNNPNCRYECGYWNTPGNKVSELCVDCCKQVCWYQDYIACSDNFQECQSYRPAWSVLCKCGADEEEDNSESPYFCCPNGCPGGYTQRCMPDTIKRGTCCYNKSGGLYKVNPAFGNSQPKYPVLFLGDPPCGVEYDGCNDGRCKEYVEPPELECRKTCRDCYCEYQPGVGWIPSVRQYGIISFTIVCVGSPWQEVGPECGQSFSLFVRRENDRWVGSKTINELEVSVELSRSAFGQCQGCELDADPPGTLYHKAGCGDGCTGFGGGGLCHCQNGGADCTIGEDEDCDPLFCKSTDACDACGQGVQGATFPCHEEDDGTSYFCYPFEKGPCGSCCPELIHGDEWCEGNGISDTGHCCGWWPGDGSYQKCQQGPYGACGHLLKMRYELGTCPAHLGGTQCVHCPGGLSCQMEPMAENIHFEHEAGRCGGKCEICREPEENDNFPPNTPCYYEHCYGKVFKCTGIRLFPNF